MSSCISDHVFYLNLTVLRFYVTDLIFYLLYMSRQSNFIALFTMSFIMQPSIDLYLHVFGLIIYRGYYVITIILMILIIFYLHSFVEKNWY